ncbi:type III-B CRISPR module RAMP protein Cmr4 [Saccharolobus islandicus]|uniref:CRISPR-associated protein, Cmr4 n=1 Tax=Saccharolobus islandicus LAL14/1 TaxID=1241935 RepID=M9UD00_SACIS|nr:type III-B CRISPR module RAMP protein Cmr4 [Sulfolobus islandicus]AGJ62070.1 CRISPR-associated protein, Cmr4 [Sulfolobus islandicus LAL14/1]
MKGIPFVVYAITSLHVGMGRSSGVVDLPIQRDPQGFPIIFSSTFKGALKQYCGTVYNAINNNGRIDCSKANVCCCLFGGEEETDVTSIISISDLYPIAIPVPSLDKGYVYLTSRYLINTVVDLFNAVNYEEGVKLFSSTVPQSKVTIGTDIEVPLVKVSSNLLNILSSLSSIAKKLNEGIAIEDDDSKAVLEVERGIIKYTRNRINLNTKTVVTGSLWTEEYLPHGSIFAGIMSLNTPRRNKYCNSDKICDDECAYQKVNEFVKNKEFYLNVGGKETIGKGIVKVRILG